MMTIMTVLWACTWLLCFKLFSLKAGGGTMLLKLFLSRIYHVKLGPLVIGRDVIYVSPRNIVWATCHSAIFPTIVSLNYILTSRSYVYLINQLTPWLMEPGGSMPHSQGLSNNSYPEANQPSSPHWYISLQGPFKYCPPVYALASLSWRFAY